MTAVGDAAVLRLPRRLRLLVLGCIGAGAAAILVTLAQVLTAPAPSPWNLPAVVAVAIVGDISLLSIRFGHSGNSETWAEAALILGVVIGGWDWFIVLAPAAVVARQLLAGRPTYKALFNGGSVATGAVVARMVYWPLSGDWSGMSTTQPIWRVAAGFVVGACAYFLWIGLLVSLAVALAQGIPASHVWRKSRRLRFVMLAGNSAAGVGAVILSETSPSTLLVLPFVFLLLYVLYNSYLSAQQERDTWRELHEATHAMNRVDHGDVIASIRLGASSLFGAEQTEVLTGVDDTLAFGLRSPALLSAAMATDGAAFIDVRRGPAPVVAELTALGLTDAMVAPMQIGGGRIGGLLIGYRGKVLFRRSRELQVFATLANHAALSLQHARLFAGMDAQRTRLSAIVDNASDGIVLLDGAGRVCSWNPAMVRMTGCEEEAAIGTSLVTALGAERDGEPLTAAWLLERLATTEHLEVAASVIARSGSRRETVLSISAVQGARESLDYVVLVARDVTAQREAEISREDFIGSVSHELRTPLTPLKGYLGVLRRPGFAPNPAQLSAIYSTMYEQAGHLERIVEDLLSVAGMQRGHFQVTLAAVDVEALVARVVEDFRTTSAREVDLAATNEDGGAICDPDRLRQVLSNLLSNADKYSPAQTPVHVALRRVGAAVEVTVRDHGPGIPDEAREVVFERFRRLGDHMTRGINGTGLGLYIARRLIEAMGGQIWVDRAADGGAVFHVTVPTGQPVSPALAAPGDRSSAYVV